MKKNDIAVIILIVAVSLLTSYFGLSALLGEAKTKPAKVEVVEPISANVKEPSPKIFNQNAINPTVIIQIGKPSEKQPF